MTAETANTPPTARHYAHSAKDLPETKWQGLWEHLDAVADLAAQFGRPLGIEAAARAAGLLHDLGKYAPAFQARLRGDAAAVDHSTAGAAEILGSAAGLDGMIGQLIAYAIAGHHAGLPDRIGEAGSLDARLAQYDPSVLDPVWRQEVTPVTQGLAPDGIGVPPAKSGEDLAFRLSVLGRMIFSCLVDADFRDTEAFYHSIDGTNADRMWPRLADVLPDFLTRFDAHMSSKSRNDNQVNRLRGENLAHVRSKAGDAPGFFTLTVPTGGGKTLASLGFALDHARAHGHSRILYAIPFTSIIDQTAAIFRDILGDENVLEHHSAIDDEKHPCREGRDKLKLAMEDWAAPVVVTTNVQLFESLFASRASRCRKLHNIASSVIILDEAQTIPRPLLAPCVQMLAELVRGYGCTIVLCTATQPALDARHFEKPSPLALPLAGRELAPDPERLARDLKRVTLHQAGARTNAELTAALAAQPQGLVIVNSRRHALELYLEAKSAGLAGLVHLSTRQHAADRREILAGIRQRLEARAPCRVIATSLIEAGVDVDFPRVWRAEAGLDQIAQAAGRCNREGARDRNASVVTIFTAPDYPPPNEIKGLIGDRARMADKHQDLLSPAAIADYFGEVYWRLGERIDGKAILPKFKLSGANADFDYRPAAMSKNLRTSCRLRKYRLACWRANCNFMLCRRRRRRGKG
jgi:CRISPR-associated endonuclease/helicase Cas3